MNKVTMFFNRLIFAALLSLLFSVSANASDEATEVEEEKPWSIDSNVGFFSNYMFRGQTLYDGPSIQPSVTGAYDTGEGEVSLNLWMHISGNSRSTERAPRYTELDETIKYSNSFGPVTVSIGNAWYTYSDYQDGTNIEDTAEYLVSATYDSYLTPTLSFYKDWRVYHSQYFELGISHEYSEVVDDDTSITPFAAFGFSSNGEKIYEDDGLVQVTTGVSSNLTMGDITVTPTINYSFKVDENTINQLWFGISFDYAM